MLNQQRQYGTRGSTGGLAAGRRIARSNCLGAQDASAMCDEAMATGFGALLYVRTSLRIERRVAGGAPPRLKRVKVLTGWRRGARRRPRRQAPIRLPHDTALVPPGCERARGGPPSGWSPSARATPGALRQDVDWFALCRLRRGLGNSRTAQSGQRGCAAVQGRCTAANGARRGCAVGASSGAPVTVLGRPAVSGVVGRVISPRARAV